MEKHFSGRSMSYREILASFIPLLVDQAFVTTIGLVNTVMISASGVAAISAVSMVDSINLFVVNALIAIATGGTVIVSQYFGAGNEKMVSKSAAQAVSAVTLVAVFLSAVLLIFHRPILGFLFGAADPEVMDNALIYIVGSFLSYPLTALIQVISGILRGASQQKPSMFFSLLMNGLYLAMNFVCVVLLHLGVWGLVISLLASRLLTAAASVCYILVFNRVLSLRLRDMLTLDFKILKQILFVGVPFAAEQLFFNGGKLLTQTFIVQMGTLSLAVNAICNAVTPLFQIPANAMALSIVAVVGQCMGRRDIDDSRKFIKSYLRFAPVSFLLSAVVILPFFSPLLGLFRPPQEIVPQIVLITLITLGGQIFFWPQSFIIPPALRAAGDSNYSSVVSLLSMWLFRVVLGYLLGIVFHLDITGVWVAMCCEWIVRTVIFCRRLKGDKWYRHRLIEQ